jgi:FtsP/CotA-like multicopper oxidase with cupredoxin domain
MKNGNPILVAGASLAVTLAGCASTIPAPSVPEALKLPLNQVVAYQVPATGVQIYECGESKAKPGTMEWVFKAPEADLFDTAGQKIGKHYGGPTWEAFDGSKVVGTLKARDDGPDATAIPWLLLTAKSVGPNGDFSRVQNIQRLNTVGGKAPERACTQAGSLARVPYKATYYFYTAK